MISEDYGNMIMDIWRLLHSNNTRDVRELKFHITVIVTKIITIIIIIVVLLNCAQNVKKKKGTYTHTEII